MKKGYFGNIEDLTTENTNFRKVLYTGEKMQLVLMTLQPGEEIGAEVHDGHDQFFRFEEGVGKVIVNESEYEVGDGDSVIVPSGANHNVINTSDSELLKLYTIYTPPEHKEGTLHATKVEAVEEHFDGTTTE
ncbi:MAG: cupin domain-containing protein [Candidatus Kaiserbacteria bacterium]|nr:cupin domain-containing protein [Candidatus Kaiserbacteria bacterium]MCB9816782.1 cupin domain-containing protein [Candidatus Nomurabacteria bacterium]